MHAPWNMQDFLRMKIKGNNNGVQYCGNNFLSNKGKKKLVARLIWQSWSDRVRQIDYPKSEVFLDYYYTSKLQVIRKILAG
jgi:hypothetical protein